ncbi:MAG: hypothetical protein IJ459_04570 [Clostridia bacterium]|nr:hypothetical protein [Clostridia bacterium]
MATSGSKTIAVTSWDDLVFSWSVAAQDARNNHTTVSWTLKLVAGSSGRISSSASKAWSVTVNGVTYSGTNTIGISNNSTKTLASGQTQINHNADGTKSFSYSFSQAFDITFSGSSIGTKSGSGTGELPTIPRQSTLTVAAGTLGTAQTMTITRKTTAHKNKIRYKCGSASGYIAGSASAYTSDTSISWTPPIALASQNTYGTTVTVTVYLDTYLTTGALVGTTTYYVNYSIPASVKPSCTITVEDPTGVADAHGWAKGVSKFKVVITPTTSYGSAIASYSTTANGSTYTTASFTTDVLKSSGNLTITATVKDNRGRTGTASKTISVDDYSPCTIVKFVAERCEADGTDNPEGEYIKATIQVAVHSLAVGNLSPNLWYKKASESENEYTFLNLSSDELGVYEDLQSGAEIWVVLPVADGSNSYDIKFTIDDGISSATRVVTVSTAFALMEFNIDKKAVAFGKRIEEENLFDVGLQSRFMGGLKPPVLEPETDLNEVRTPNTYTGANISSYNYANCPVTSGTFTLIVESGGEDGQVIQTYKTVSKYRPEIFVRHYYQGAWGNWLWSSTDEFVLYESAAGSTGQITLSASSANYRYLEIYFTDNNGKSGGYTKVWNPAGKTVCLHIQEAGSTIFSRQTLYHISGTTMAPDTTTASYFKMTSAGAVTTSIGTNYIKIVRVIGRA